jgi:hypothetical protein
VSVFLCRDAWGSPSATQTYLGTVTPTEQSGTTNNSVVRLVVAGKVPVSQGLDYWLESQRRAGVKANGARAKCLSASGRFDSSEALLKELR